MDTTPIELGLTHQWVPVLLQVSDPLFPTGSYAHSLGFEESVRLGLARDEASLRHFLIEQILPVLASFELPYLRFAHQAARDEDVYLLRELDAEVGASKLARETREGSAQLGGRRLKALRVILPDDPKLAACEAALRSGTMAGHHVIVCGVQAVAANIPLEAALNAYAYGSLAAVGGAALKLMRIGQDGVQRALRGAVAGIAPTVARSLTVLRDEAGWFNPLLEIASMRHEHAGDRLFIS